MLDPVSKAGVFALLAQVKKTLDLTVVVIEHNLEQLVEVCDRMILLQDGKIAVDAPLGTFFQQIPASARDSIRVPGTVTFFDLISSAPGRAPVRLDEVTAACNELLETA